MHKLTRFIAALGLMAAFAALFSASPVLAMDGAAGGVAETMVDKEVVRQRLLQVRPDLPILGIEPSAMVGLWEVKLPSGQMLFVSADAQHFVVGELFEITENRFVNAT
ncbi:MAG: hypothetical protein ACI81O_002484, partial [Cyclobacteriaceae bacterium]